MERRKVVGSELSEVPLAESRIPTQQRPLMEKTA